MTDHLDQPEPDATYGLVFPFVVCASQGGPYDDAAFVAGCQVGRVDRSLALIAAADGDGASFTVYTALVPQLELVGMHHGFPVIQAVQVEETDQHPAMPEWTHIRFSRSREGG